MDMSFSDGARSTMLKQRCLLQPFPRHLTVLFDAIDAEPRPTQALRNEQCSSTSREGIEHDATMGAASEDAGFDERFGKHREVHIAEFAQGNRPNGSFVSALRMESLIPPGVV